MTQEEINKIILDNWDKEGLANGWVNEHIKNNELKQQVEYLQSKIDKANEYLESHFIFDDENGEYYQTHTFDKDNAKELHDILKEDK